MTSSKTSGAFAWFEVDVADSPRAECLAAEAYAAGAVGLEEREREGGGIVLLLYAPAARAEAVRAAVGAAARAGEGVGALRPVAPRDWSVEWKRGLGAIAVSPRLLVRPSFVDAACEPGQAELVVDPGQAFGTGGHASTRLALEWIDELAPRLPTRARVLDVGAGTGILALAAVRLAGCRAVAFDLDPLAAPAARANARANGLSDRIDLFTGPLAAVAPAPFDLVLANLLRLELLPLVSGIAARTRSGGAVVVSGLLASESSEVEAALAAAGLGAARRREQRDAAGDHWVALLTTR